MMNSDQFIEAIKQQMLPDKHVQHPVDTLQRLFALTPADATLADLVAGWQVLARPHSQNEEASVAHRQKMCAEMAAFATQFASEPGNLVGAVKTWQAWQDAFQRSTDPYHAILAKTFARELVESFVGTFPAACSAKRNCINHDTPQLAAGVVH